MPKTVAEILKESGFSDEDIKALDGAKMEGLTKVVSSANDALTKASEERRLQAAQYDQEIAPALAGWADRDTALSTKVAAYEAWISKAKDSGYLTPEILSAMPTFGTPQNPPQNPNPGASRDASGKFVAGANPVPGSPGFVDTNKIHQDLQSELARAFSFSADTQWKYRQLFGKEMPDSPTTIIREATANRMSPSDWAAKKYEFVAREQALKTEEQKKHDDAIRKEVADAKDREWAEKVGSNPNVRIPQESAFAQISKATQEGKRQDPLKMTAEQRKANTHTNIQKEFAERSSMVQ